MSNLWSDLRFASRTLRAKPVFSSLAIVSLALGIGANTAIFSVVESTLLRRLPYRNPEQLVRIRDHQPCCEAVSMAPGEYLDYKRQTQTLQDFAAWTYQNVTLTGNGEAHMLQGRPVTTNFFDVLGAKAELGRLMTASIDKTGAEQRVAVLSDPAWHTRFNADPGIIGTDIRLNGIPFRVIGVLAPKQEFPGDAEVWFSPRVIVPEYQELTAIPTNIAQEYGTHWLQGLGRLRPGVSPEMARTELKTLGAHIAAAHPDHNGHWAVLSPLQDTIVQQVRPAVLILWTAVVVLLLIACANIAGLMLARSTARTRELAIRFSMGASRWEITRLLLSETFLLAFAGGVCGILFGIVALRLIHIYSPYELPAAPAPQLNLRVLAFCLAVTFLSALISGLVPALNSARIDVNEGLKESAKGSSSRKTHRIRGVLVTAEVALSVMLLISACLLIRSFSRVLSVYPGFNPVGVLTAQIALPEFRYTKTEQINEFWTRLVTGLQALPGVQVVGVSSDVPLTGTNADGDFEIEGHPVAPLGKGPYGGRLEITPDALRALGVPLLAGRSFNDHDQTTSKPVVIINKTAADRLFVDQDPVGKRLRVGKDSPWETIMGVVGDVKWDGLTAEPTIDVYRPYSQLRFAIAGTVMVRLKPGGTLSAADLRSILRNLDPDIPVERFKPLQSYVDESLGQRRFVLGLLAAFSFLAILLAGIGLNAVLAYSVEQRRQEIGIRVALGANRPDVLWMILRDCLVIAVVGALAGLVGGVWSSSLLHSMLFGVSSEDAIAYISATILILAVAVTASLVPATRAARVDPVSALRYE